MSLYADGNHDVIGGSFRSVSSVKLQSVLSLGTVAKNICADRETKLKLESQSRRIMFVIWDNVPGVES